MRAPLAILTIATLALATAAAGCGPMLLQGPHIAKDAEIADKPEHRALLEIVERYRLSMEARDTKALLALASPDYFERAGTTAADDDYGYEKLGEILTNRFKRLKLLRLHVIVDGIRMDQPGRAVVDYTYVGRFLVKGKLRDNWAHKSWESRFRFLQRDGRWWFVSGM